MSTLHFRCANIEASKQCDTWVAVPRDSKPPYFCARHGGSLVSARPNLLEFQDLQLTAEKGSPALDEAEFESCSKMTWEEREEHILKLAQEYQTARAKLITARRHKALALVKMSEEEREHFRSIKIPKSTIKKSTKKDPIAFMVGSLMRARQALGRPITEDEARRILQKELL